MLQIYKASAGSGKTYNLTREYIKFLIAVKDEKGRYRLRRHPMSDHSRILAITFTNKATGEMTHRIIKELATLAGMASDDELKELGLEPADREKSTLSSPYYKDFTNPDTGLGCTADELRKAARTALTNLLYDYSYFNVSTIDSFFQSVLRMFTREVELPDNYNVELDNKFAISLGVDEMYTSLNYHTIKDTPENVEQQWVKAWLLEFMKDRMLQGKSFNIFSRSSSNYSELIDELSSVTDEEFKKRLPLLRPYFADHTRLMKFAAAVARLTDTARDEMKALAARVLETVPDIEKNLSTNYVNALRKIVNNTPLTSDGTIVSAATDPNKAVKAAARKVLSDSYQQLCVSAAAAYVRYKSVKSQLDPIRRHVYIFGLISTVMNYIDAYCRDNQLILLNETNNILHGLINDDETPFIYEKLGYYLDHFLIDEFQDTSAMQWENLKPLLMESLSRGNDNLVIGDEKQCIYRFRSSDPRLLGEQVNIDTTERFNTDEIVQLKGIDIVDNSNWRSSPEIVLFNNTLFMDLARQLDDKFGNRPGVLSATRTYTNTIQQIDDRRKTVPGYVKVRMTQPQTPGRKPKTDDATEAKPVSATDSALDFMLTELRRQLDSGYEPGDIAILVRGKRDGKRVIDFLLAKMNDPADPLRRFDIISEEAVTLDASRAVRLITSVLRLVSLPEFLEADELAVAKARGQHTNDIKRHDAYRRARLVNRFHFYLHLTHDDGSAYTASEALEAALKDNKTPTDSATDTDETAMKSLLDMECPSLPAIVERIIHAFVPPALKASENLFLSTYQDAVIEFTKRGNHDIRSFLDWWDKGGHRTAITLPADINAVTVMTIHKAKGLEFPCVHIPFAGGDMFKSESVDWVDFDTARFAEIGIDETIVPPAMPLAITKAMTESDLYGRSCADIVAQTNIDELNVNYVAFTRPTRELIVNCSAAKEGTFSKLVENAFMTLDDSRIDSLGITDVSRQWVMTLADRYADNILTIGEPTTPVRSNSKKAPRPMLELKRYTTAPDLKRMTARTQPDALEPFDPTSQRHLGNFMHAVMSLIMTPDDLDNAMKRQVYRHRMREPLASQLKQRLHMALTNQAAARWFGDFTRVITERPISNNGRDTRIDRVVWLPDGTIEVVDYKFVDRLPSSFDDNDTHRKYIRQVKGYCNSIRGNTHARVNGYIWYIGPDDNMIVKI